MDTHDETGLGRYQMPAFIIGILGLIGCVVGFMSDPLQFYRSYLFAFIFCVGIPLGSLALLMIQYLSGGVWGILIRPNLLAAIKTLPFLAIAFLPVAAGLHSLYEWTHHDVVMADPVLSQKTAYLNEPFFFARTAAYFVLWNLWAFLLVRHEREFAESGSPRVALRLRRLSAAGLLMLSVTLTFASVDWVMSLEPHWFSTMYGISFMVGSLLIAHAISLVALTRNSRYQPIATVARPIHFRDLGNFMLGFVMLWAYTAFSQFLLIWYGNIREEITWYAKRSQGAWLLVASILLVFHFFLPFFLLLMRGIKDRPEILQKVAFWVILMRLLDTFWIITPAFHGEAFHFHWLDIAAPLGLGGIWVGLFVGNLKKRPLVPMHEPYVREALSHG